MPPRNDGREETRCSFVVTTFLWLLRRPELLEVPEYGLAAAFWWCFDLKKLRDAFQTGPVEDETRVINGWRMLGLAERRVLKGKVLGVFGG